MMIDLDADFMLWIHHLVVWGQVKAVYRFHGRQNGVLWSMQPKFLLAEDGFCP